LVAHLKISATATGSWVATSWVGLGCSLFAVGATGLSNTIFGKAVGYVYTIKYQKHGLPHAHLIIFLDQSSRLSSPQAIDRYISTEFPDEETQP
jgi:hypothetical protein